MILIFDLDDTLYDERIYVLSGLRAVATYGHDHFGWDPTESFQYMLNVLDSYGRGQIFDAWLVSKGKYSRSLVKKCVNVYRHHTPSLKIEPYVEELLRGFKLRYPLYMVTDGHKIVQQKKVEALGIAHFFRKVMITHRYGIRYAKPSTYCFELIRKNERCRWEDMIYVGDNPTKDFVNLNPLGVKTVRVSTGVHRNVEAMPGYDAHYSIANLAQLPDILNACSRPTTSP